MTPVRMRQSPSGKLLGDPPYQIGPGADTIIVRTQGAGANQYLPASETVINGLGSIPVTFRTGYLYALAVETEVVATNLLPAGSYRVKYQLHAAGVWGAWHNFQRIHSLPLMNITATPTRCDEDIMFVDQLFALTFATDIDQIQFAVYGDANNGTKVVLVPSGCRAIITEYLS